MLRQPTGQFGYQGEERHPLTFRDELKQLAKDYDAQVPALRKAVRAALEELRNAQAAAAECREWAKNLGREWGQGR